MQQREHIQDIYPLTGMQQGMLFHSLYSDNNRNYFTQARLHFEGKIEINAFKQAWVQLLENHPILRTALVWEGQAQPLQIVYKAEFVDLPFEYLDWRSQDASDQQIRLEEFLQADYAQGFSLNQAPLMRLTLIQIEDQAFHFIWSHHHIVLDGWCLPRLVQESLLYYRQRLSGNKAQSINTRPYRDFIAWLKTQDGNSANSYWTNYLTGFSKPTPLLFGRPDNDKKSKLGNTESCLYLSTKLTEQLNSFVQKQRVTLNTVVQAVWTFILSRYSGEDDVLCGVTVSGRPAQLADSESMIGLFINTLPLRVRFDNSLLLSDFLQALQQQNIALRQFEHTPLADIQAQSELEAGSSLFESLIVFENYPMDGVLEQTDLGFSLSLLNLPENSPSLALSAERNNYPLTLVVAPEEQLMLMLAYQRDRFSSTIIETLLKQFELVISTIVQAPTSIRLGELALTEQVKNPVAKLLEKPEPIQQAIEAIASRYPTNLAVVGEDFSLNYAELNNRANQVAHALRSHHISEGQCIALCMQRSATFVITLLGVLKAGCYYLPLDTRWPARRINELLKNSQASLLISDISIENPSAPLLQLDKLISFASQQSTESLNIEISPAHWAYLIYTSGSTGKPKGVAVSHSALSHYIHSINSCLNMTPELKLGMLSTPSADLGHTMLFGALCYGASLHMVPFETSLSPQAFADYNVKHQLDIIKIAPSQLSVLLVADKPNQVLPKQTLILGGEALDADFSQQIQKIAPHCRLLNHYGPTETAVGVSTFSLSDGNGSERVDSIPIGQALKHARLYILDSAGQSLPENIAGELYIGGESLADGYIGSTALTAERFIPDPFSSISGARMYRSGDRVCRRADDALVFIGRVDRQLNINGHRIELGEIEAILQTLPDIKTALARVYLDSATGRQQIVAYLLADDNLSIDSETIRATLTRLLPDYMIPQRFISLQQLPISANGKIDETALEKLASIKPETVFNTPSNKLEGQLLEIWKAVLKIDQISVSDNFFELGGDSIMSLQIIAQARRLGYKITPKQIFDTPTITDLATKIKPIEPKKQAKQTLKNEQPLGEIPLSPIQNWFFEKHPDGEKHWNQALLFETPATFVFEAFKTALNAVYAQHTALQLHFSQHAGKWQQQFGKQQKIQPEYIDISMVDDLQKTINMLCQLAQHSLNISEGPLFKVLFFDAGQKQKGRLLFVAHHLVIDAISWRILLEDLETFYQQAIHSEPLQLPDHQTCNFSQWIASLQRYSKSGAVNAEIAYWSAMISVPLQAEINQGKNTVKSIQTVNATLSLAETQSLIRGIHGVYRTRIDDIILTAIVGAITELSNNSAITIEMESHGRHALDQELEHTRSIGWYTSRYPLTFQFANNGNNGMNELLSIKEQLRAVPNQGIGYGVLNYFMDKSPLAEIQASVSYNNLGQVDDVIGRDAWLKPASESVCEMRNPQSLRSQLIDITVKIMDDRLHLQWAYSSNCQQRSSVEELANLTKTRLQQLIVHCQQAESRLSASDVKLSGLNQQALSVLLESTPEVVEDIYPATPLQQGLLFHSQYAPNTGMYINQFSAELDDLDINAFSTAWQYLLDRHEILRTAFRSGTIGKNSELIRPLQLVMQKTKLTITIDDLRKSDPQDIKSYCQQLLETDRQQGFDLAKAPLMRLQLLRLADKRYRLLWSRHHLLLDGWSSSLLITELFNCYRNLIQGKTPGLPKIPAYRNYIAWLETKHGQQDIEKANTFWGDSLSGISRPTPLPRTFKTSEQTHCISKKCKSEWTQKLKSWTQTQGLTLNTVCQGAWALLLSQHSSEQDIVFGVTVSGRPPELEGAESMLGLFINSLPLRVKIDFTASLADWLKAIQILNGKMRDYEYSSLTDIQACSQIPAGTALFDSLLVFENYPLDVALSTDIASLKISHIDNQVMSHYPLMLVISPDEELHLELQSRDLTEADNQALLDQFTYLIDQFIEVADQPLNKLSLLSGAERQAILQQQSSKAHAVAGNLALSFEHFSVKQADAIAVSFEGKTLNYAELNQHANQLAHALLAQGVVAESPVGLSSQPSLHLLIGVLGILKAGGCYVPLDPQQPEQRLSFVCHDANIRWIVADTVNIKLQKNLKSDSISWLNLEGDQLSAFSDSNPNIPVSPQQLAYIIYTSGSTGTPKGVGISHAQVLRLFSACEAHFKFNADDVWSLFHAYSFDFSVWEIWGALLYGGRVAVVPYQTRRSPEAFAQLICNERITVLSQTPSAFYGLSEVLLNLSEATPLALRYLVFGGEALDAGRLRPWFKEKGDQQPQLINMYGITETTVHVSYKRIKLADAEQPQGNAIGRPLDDLQAYVLDRQQQLLPLGVAGELYIGGAGIGRGYLARPGLTAERFIPDVYSGKADARLYKTGDQAVCLADGSLRYLGRLDQQVQLRGFRIELGEIEARIREIAGITDVAVMLREDVGSEPLLIAYLGGSALETAVREQLAEILPDYMLPARYVAMQTLPLTVNGKLDRNALPKPDAIIENQSHIAPRTETEQQLAQIWAELLGLENIGVHDNFFALGGHSLLATRIASRIKKVFDTELPLQALFQAVTISELAICIEASQKQADDSVDNSIQAIPRRTSIQDFDKV